jgi:Domain of unknown function (DUF4258)
MYRITINNILYTVTDYAAQRLIQRHITDSIVITTIEKGDLHIQENGRYRYEHQVDSGDNVLVIRVIINPDNNDIVTVYNDTQPKDR